MKQEIQEFFKGDIENTHQVLEKYSRDASIFEVMPEMVLFPKDSEDVKNLVKWVNENKTKYPNLSITARAAGTCMSGGSINESIILDFTRYMNSLVSFDELNKITVLPGMYYRDFEKITLEKNMILPCYTASKSLNAVGGMFGNNSAGERTLKYGKTEDYVLESKVVFADGNEYIVKPLSVDELELKIAQGDFEGNLYKNIYELIKANQEDIIKAKPKVHKNSAGYYLWNVIDFDGLRGKENYFDLNRLLVGSQGTLGITTEITFRLVEEKKYSKLVVIFMKDLKDLGKLIDEALTLGPDTFEVYDDKTMNLAIKFFPDFLKNKGLWGMIKFMFSFLPEAFMMLKRGLPKLILLAEFSGENEREVNLKSKDFEKKLAHFNLNIRITRSEAEANKYWDIRRESFALLRKHVKGLHTAPFIDDIIVRPEFLPEFLPKLNQILSQYDIVYTMAGHIGDGNFHIIPLMDFKKIETSEIILELGEKVYDLVLEYEGSITAEHNDGLIRTSYLDKMFGLNIITLFKKVKELFDPKYSFNPGKKVPILNGPGTKSYLEQHITIEQVMPHSS